MFVSHGIQSKTGCLMFKCEYAKNAIAAVVNIEVIVMKYKNIKEGKRMAIEMVKVLFIYQNSNHMNNITLDKICKENGLSLHALAKSRAPTAKSNNLVRGTPGKTRFGLKAEEESQETRDEEVSAANKSISLINVFLKNINDFSDLEEEKIKRITFLTIPRRLNMIIPNEGYDRKFPFIFMLTPSGKSYNSGVENYLFIWKHPENLGLVGYVDIINIDGCSISDKYESSFQINVNMQNEMMNKIYIIQAESGITANKYAINLHYVSQLIRCRTFKKSKV